MVEFTGQAARAALQWYIDNGADEALGDAPVDRLAVQAPPPPIPMQPVMQPQVSAPSPRSSAPPVFTPSAPALLGTSDSRSEAVRLAKAASTVEELREALASFDGLAIRKTATNLVFCDGNPAAPVMLVGEAPGADEDRQGKPFVGVSGQLLDRIFACIGLDRKEEDPARAVYISNILNWRPPGNRTPSPAEVEISLPFIEKHIMLIKPKALIFCGGVSAKGLLGSEESVSKLRGKGWHEYRPLTKELGYDGPAIPAIATYHPAYLLRTPAQKKAVWADMLAVKEKLKF